VLRAKGILPPKPQKELELTHETLVDLVESTIQSSAGNQKKSLQDCETLEDLDELEDDFMDSHLLEYYLLSMCSW
jgi:hypothetical protein